VLLRDGAGAALGGVTAYTDRGWLYLDCFWLPDGLRRGGWGSRVLAAAEAEALRRGCRHARLFTYSFQARGFYERHGYTVFGVLDGFPPGHSQIWMRKDLAG
jgi:GNAT superfamily N-acetyltransferase